MKKLIIFCLIFSGCFGCLCSDISPKWNIDDFDISIYDLNYNSPTNGIIEGDSIQLRINFSPEFVESGFYNSFSLINSTYATKCQAPGYEGLQDQIINFTTTSNSIFNEFEADESLNSIIRVQGELTIDEWISDSENWNYDVINQADLTITEKPLTSQTHEFKIKIEFESGKILESKSEEIQWN